MATRTGLIWTHGSKEIHTIAEAYPDENCIGKNWKKKKRCNTNRRYGKIQKKKNSHSNQGDVSDSAATLVLAIEAKEGWSIS